jgi:putative Ca2+/H+ antiporter (TMEM165/GDT1 family)
LGLTIVTALAVIGGKLMADKVSPRVLAVIGGIIFLLFAV